MRIPLSDEQEGFYVINYSSHNTHACFYPKGSSIYDFFVKKGNFLGQPLFFCLFKEFKKEFAAFYTSPTKRKKAYC